MGRKDYSHLSLEEREHVSLGLVQGKSLRSLARELDRSPSTLSREVRRNRGWREYRATLLMFPLVCSRAVVIPV